MPRRPPGAIRAVQDVDGRAVRQWAREAGPIDGLSSTTTANVRVVEYEGSITGSSKDRAFFDVDPFREHVRPGHTAQFLGEYRKFLRQPGRKLRPEASLCPACPGCRYMDIAVVRDALEAVTRLLPPPARAEMRRLLRGLDSEFRQRTQSDSSPRLGWNGEPLPWWHRRIYRQ